MGLQVIGNFFDEGRILQVASAYEAASGFRNLLAAWWGREAADRLDYHPVVESGHSP